MATALRVDIRLLLVACIVAHSASESELVDQTISVHGGYGPFDPAPRPGGWMVLHDTYLQEIADLAAAPMIDLVFYGDSITEFARGTCVGQPCNQDTAAVFKHVIAEKYKAKIFAISGDQTPHLLWRVMNGELGALLPKVIVILIGTNDLGAVVACHRNWLGISRCKDPAKEASNLVVAAERAAATIAATVDFLLQHGSSNSTQILLQAVLPRGFAGVQQPSMFTEAIGVINHRLQELASTRLRTHFADCSADFLSPEDGWIVEAFMPDALHPSPAAAPSWARK